MFKHDIASENIEKKKKCLQISATLSTLHLHLIWRNRLQIISLLLYISTDLKQTN